jgi:hypothetical protein
MTAAFFGPGNYPIICKRINVQLFFNGSNWYEMLSNHKMALRVEAVELILLLVKSLTSL